MTSTNHSRSSWPLVGAALVGPVAAGVGTLALLAERDRLPEQIVIHWGVDGPDGWASFSHVVILAAFATVVVPLLLIAIGAFARPEARASIAPIAGSLPVVLGTMFYGGTLAQRDGAASSPGPWIVIGLLAGALVGFLLWRLWRWVPDPQSPREGVPMDAPRLDVPGTTRLAWTQRLGIPALPLVVVSVAALLPVTYLAFALEPWLWVVVAALAVLVLAFASMRVVIDRTGLRLTSLGLSWSHIPLTGIASAEQGRVSPLREFGGWGRRMALDGRSGYVTRTGEALVIHRMGAPDFLVSVDRADEAAAVLNTLASRVGGGPSVVCR